MCRAGLMSASSLLDAVSIAERDDTFVNSREREKDACRSSLTGS